MISCNRIIRSEALKPAVILGVNPNGFEMECIFHKKDITTITLDYEKGCSLSEPEKTSMLLDYLNQLIDTFSSAVLFISTDLFARQISQIRENLDDRYKFILPPHKTVENCIDKFAFAELCNDIGIISPYTHRLTSYFDIEEYQLENYLPGVLKPDTDCPVSKKIISKTRIINSVDELRQVADLLLIEQDCPFIFQQLIRGSSEDRYFVGGFVADDEEISKLFMGSKLLESPVTGGTGTHLKLESKQEVLDLFALFVQKTGYKGLIDFEIMFDVVERKYKMIEVNPRIGALHPISRCKDMDIIYYYYCYLNDLHIDAYKPQIENKKYLILQDHFCSLLSNNGFFSAASKYVVDLYNADCVTGFYTNSLKSTIHTLRGILGCTKSHLLKYFRKNTSSSAD